MIKIKLWKKVLIGILILCLLLIGVVVNKFVILTKLTNKSKQISNKANYLAIATSLQNNYVTIQKSYNKNGNYLTKTQIYGKDIEQERSFTTYNKENEKVGIIQYGEEKTAIINGGNMLGGQVHVNSASDIFEDTLQRLKWSIASKITTNDKYYIVELNNSILYINKQTGLIDKSIDNAIMSEVYYEFDVVTDSDIERPDISDCKIKEEN